MCKHGNVFSLAVLIGRGLDHNPSWFKIALSSPIGFLLLPLFSFQGMRTLNTVGVDGGEGTPVPIPNTVVKLFSAENTWRAAAREDKATPTFFIYCSGKENKRHNSTHYLIIFIV